MPKTPRDSAARLFIQNVAICIKEILLIINGYSLKSVHLQEYIKFNSAFQRIPRSEAIKVRHLPVYQCVIRHVHRMHTHAYVH